MRWLLLLILAMSAEAGWKPTWAWARMASAVAACAASAADGVTTFRLHDHFVTGRAFEGNPLQRRADGSASPGRMFAIKGGVCTAQVLMARRTQHARAHTIANTGIAAGFTIVAVRNDRLRATLDSAARRSASR